MAGREIKQGKRAHKKIIAATCAAIIKIQIDIFENNILKKLRITMCVCAVISLQYKL
jgi:hypothetical protein